MSYILALYHNNVARLNKKNVECGPRVKKVAHPWSRLSSFLTVENFSAVKTWDLKLFPKIGTVNQENVKNRDFRGLRLLRLGF
jgi:hypothetical protein